MAILTPLATEPGARRRLRVSSPATREPIGEIEIQTADDVRYAVEAARKAQPAWEALGVDERARYMRRALDVVLERQDEIVEVVVRESGKPANEARMMEVFSACDSLTYYAKHAPRALRPEKRRMHGLLRFVKSTTVVYRPLGVVGVISPWNSPVTLALNPTVQALLAGNAVVLKPSEVTPFSGALVGEIFQAVDLPDGVLTVLTGDGETGAALCEADVDKISFTGSVETGLKVAESCARRLVPCTLELGGKDPMIVCADADLDVAAGGAVAGAFLNSGQYCCGTERVYVVEEVAGAFTDRVVKRVAELRQGSGGEFDVGAIFQECQLEIVEEHVADAVAKGAKVRAGGRRNPHLEGLFYEPTILTHVTHDMKIMQEETFGPVLPIMHVRDDDEAVRHANDTRYGLGANVWSRDRRRAFQIARRIDSGSVCINDMTMTYSIAEAPFGGRKQSGLGQVNGVAGLRGYCYAQPIISDRSGGKRTAKHYPYTTRRDQGLRRLLRLYFGSPLGRWLA
jgi:succinate-semialdehyde dehydrogenase/glutarate-semialdehyde dehydrogenase